MGGERKGGNSFDCGPWWESVVKERGHPLKHTSREADGEQEGARVNWRVTAVVIG